LNLAGNSAGKNNMDIAEQDEAPSTKAIYDLSAIKILSKNDDVLFNKVLNILISMLSSERENIKSLAKKNSWKEVGEIVHKIKTSLVHIHVDSLTQVIKDLEHYENHSDEKLTLLADELCDSLENILVYLKIDMVTLMNEKKATI
jgi:HPt (histidine-containing phosphotransfer) domain-containing protein